MIKLNFYLKSDKVNHLEEYPIFLKLSYQGKSCTLSTGKRITKERWNSTNKLENPLRIDKEQNYKIALGNLLYKTHEGLQNQYCVSCIELDFLVENAKKNSTIIGARMMGGGFGGCTLNIVEKSALNSFTKTVAKAYKDRFNKHCSFYTVEFSRGTHLVE